MGVLGGNVHLRFMILATIATLVSACTDTIIVYRDVPVDSSTEQSVVTLGDPGSGNGDHDHDTDTTTDTTDTDTTTDDCYADFDGDGYGNSDDPLPCGDSDSVDDDTDCNDDDTDVNPGAVEVTDDGIDNDCDGDVDEDAGGCEADEALLVIVFDAPAGATNIKLGGMLETPYGFFEPNFYTSNMSTGSPIGMTVVTSGGDLVASYNVCLPKGERVEFSGSYTLSGTTYYSCQGASTFVEYGDLYIEVDGAEDQGDLVSNGANGCEHEFWL